MSQFYVQAPGGTPAIPTSFVTDDGTAIPAANILDILGKSSNENNSNGIISKGGIAGTGTANEVDIVLTNRLFGSTSTTGSSTSTIVSFTPTLVGTYAFESRIAAYNITSSLGSGYSLFGTIRFDGVNSTLCGTPDKIENEEGAMSSANSSLTVSGSNILFNGTGYAAQTINWSAICLYTYVGA